MAKSKSKVEAPKVEAPKVEAPKVEAPKSKSKYQWVPSLILSQLMPPKGFDNIQDCLEVVANHAKGLKFTHVAKPKEGQEKGKSHEKVVDTITLERVLLANGQWGACQFFGHDSWANVELGTLAGEAEREALRDVATKQLVALQAQMEALQAQMG